MELLERILVMSILVRYHVTITSISLQWALAESRNDLSFSNVKSVPGGLADPISIVLYGVLFVFHSFPFVFFVDRILRLWCYTNLFGIWKFFAVVCSANKRYVGCLKSTFTPNIY